MRDSHIRRTRIITVFPFVVLISLCFFALTAQATPDANVLARHPHAIALKRAVVARAGEDSGGDNDNQNHGAGGSGTSSPTQGSSTATSQASPTTTSTSSTPASATTTDVSSEASSATTSSSVTSNSVSSTSTSSESVSSTSTSSSSSKSSTSTSLTSSTSSTSTSSTSTISTTSSSSSAKLTTSAPGTTLIATNIAGAISTSNGASGTSAAITTLNASNSPDTSSKGFLSNTGAVAATFSIVGIVAIGLVVAAFAVIRKRRRNQELDIFDTQYNDYNAGGGDAHVVSDMTSLSANAVTHAGANDGYYNYRNSEVGLGLPPMPPSDSTRNSVTSNHAGFGAFSSAKKEEEKPKPRLPGSRLRNEVEIASTASQYSDPSPVDNNIARPYESPYYNATQSDAVSFGTAH